MPQRCQRRRKKKNPILEIKSQKSQSVGCFLCTKALVVITGDRRIAIHMDGKLQRITSVFISSKFTESERERERNVIYEILQSSILTQELTQRVVLEFPLQAPTRAAIQQTPLLRRQMKGHKLSPAHLLHLAGEPIWYSAPSSQPIKSRKLLRHPKECSLSVAGAQGEDRA